LDWGASAEGASGKGFCPTWPISAAACWRFPYIGLGAVLVGIGYAYHRLQPLRQE